MILTDQQNSTSIKVERSPTGVEAGVNRPVNPANHNQLLKKKAIMKRSKPDILVMLALILGLGVTLSGMSKGENRERIIDVNAKASGILLGTELNRQ